MMFADYVSKGGLSRRKQSIPNETVIVAKGVTRSRRPRLARRDGSETGRLFCHIARQ